MASPTSEQLDAVIALAQETLDHVRAIHGHLEQMVHAMNAQQAEHTQGDVTYRDPNHPE